MNRGINDGGDLPRELLASLFDSIKTEPFKVNSSKMWLFIIFPIFMSFNSNSINYQIPEDDGNDLMHTFFNPDREGWLWKQGGRVKSWKRRWFILNDNCLYYFEFTTGITKFQNCGLHDFSLVKPLLSGLCYAILKRSYIS